MSVLKRVLVTLIMVTVLFGCGGGDESGSSVKATDTSRARVLSVSSGPVMQLQLPFPEGVVRRCVQNSDDTPTHQGGSTFYDLDFGMNVGSVVVAAADGVIRVRVHTDNNGNIVGFGRYARVEHDNGYWTMYGHLSSFIARDGERVVAGQPIAYSGNTGNSTGPHLHFGVHSGSSEGTSQPMVVYALDVTDADVDWFLTGTQATREFVCDESTSNQNGHRYEVRQAGPSFSDYRCIALSGNEGILCWNRNPVECVDGENHVRYYINSDGASVSQRVERHEWCVYGTNQSADVLAYLEGGYGVGGVGPGTETEATELPTPDLPDFVTKRVWLTTPWGTETYQYGLNESFDTKAQSANIGDGSCLPGETTTITGHFYLSKGYKEDPHSGDGAWRRLDSTLTQCDNLMPGDTHTETKNTKISDWITEPGIYNVVYCPDHPQNDHNNGGEHAEEHESNNCSTPAVFEVVEGTVNVPDVDFTTFGLTFLQAPAYAGDAFRVGAWVKNQGTVNATADIRSSYTVSCNGGPATFLTDDRTMASTLTAGASAWEETIGLVYMPNVTGTCTVSFNADYLGAETETDETNNSTSITVTLAPRPAPILSITKFEDKVSCCTTNTGAAPKPRIRVQNNGAAAPGANVTVVYQVSSPVATGGLYQVMGYGTIEPRELPPKTYDDDQMDCDGCWRIPKTSAWKKQWHNFRACLRVDGGTPVPSTGSPSPGEVCSAVYQRYSKE